MEFAFTEEQQMIRDTAAGFLAEFSTSESVRAAMATERGYATDLWQKICDEMFWQAMHVPEKLGGIGLGYIELVSVLEQMGRVTCCSPFFSTVCLGANALLVAGNDAQQEEYLAQIVDGTTATLAYLGQGGGCSPAAISSTFAKSGSEYRLNGTLRYVVDGHTAELLVVAAREQKSQGAEGISLFILPANSAGIARRWLPTMDQTRKQAEIVLNNVAVPADGRLGEQGQAGQQLEKILDLARVAIAADQLGGAQQILDMSVAYCKEREQFGRSIASFQAIKHKAADMMLRCEVARSAVYYAACVAQEALFGENNDALRIAAELPEAASMAKAYCSDSYFFNAGCGLQLHGGVGFTWDYDVHLYFKRARSTEAFLGDGAYHRERIAHLLLDDA